MSIIDPRRSCDMACPRYSEKIHSPRLRGAGSKSSKILVVGEAPGQNEDAQGVPFIGESGRLLRDALASVKIPTDIVYITNAVKCATVGINQPPNKKTIRFCRQYLEHEIERINPHVIAVFGAIALESVLKRTGITKLKNNIYFSEEFNAKVIPIYHPAYILRNPGALDEFIQGIKLLAAESSSKDIVRKSLIKTKHADYSDRIDEVLDKLERVDKFVFDLETSSLEFVTADILCVALSWKAGVGVTINWASFSQQQLARFTTILHDKTKLKINQNLKFDLEMLQAQNIKVRGPFFDTLIAASLIDENMKEKGLDALTLNFLDIGEYWKALDDEKMKICKQNKLRKDQFSYSMFSYSVLADYAQWDADATFRLYELFDAKLTELGLQDYFKKYSIPTMELLVQLEFKGVLVDRKKLKRLICSYQQKLQDAHDQIQKLNDVKQYEKKRKKNCVRLLTEKFESSGNLQNRFGDVNEYIEKQLLEKNWVFNHRSVPQLSDILFDELKLNPVKKSLKTKKPSTDKETLELYAAQGVDLCSRILEYRRLGKYIATYLVSTYEKSKSDSRIHANYLQAKARTGRLSCIAPNMQNIPREAYDFKECLIADPGYVFVKADLKQAEFRCWANYSNDPRMLDDIASGMDIHRATASEVFQVPMKEVTKEQRTVAKACVVGSTWIPTPSGFERIKNLKTGDHVLDHFNQKQKILETIKKVDDVFTVDTECGSVTCTKDHPFKIINARAEIVDKKLGELKVGDYVLSCIPNQKRRRYLHNVKKFYYKNHPVCDIRDSIKLRKKMTLRFLKERCMGINEQIDQLVENNIYSVKIKSIVPAGSQKVYDFVTTGDKIMVANGFVTLDCTFGPMYGRGAKAIADEHNISIKQAEHIRSVLFQKYPIAAQWLNDQVAYVHEHGYVKTWLGRYRRLPEINSDDPNIVAKAEREAMNSPIQGLASSMNDYYMYKTNKLAKKSGLDVYPVVTQHDAQIFLVREGQEKKMVEIMKKVVATSFPEFKARMELDFEVGRTLGTLEPLA